jgi:cytoskeletal protein CcmA (bactofilin family)
MAASRILSGVKIDGKISGTTDVKVEGEVYGQIDLESSLYIAEGGTVEATIKASNVFIAGNFTGNVQAKELIQLSPTAKASGELKAPDISIERGARFAGSIQTGDMELHGGLHLSHRTPEHHEDPVPPVIEEEEDVAEGVELEEEIVEPVSDSVEDSDVLEDSDDEVESEDIVEDPKGIL